MVLMTKSSQQKYTEIDLAYVRLLVKRLHGVSIYTYKQMHVLTCT